uniref:Tetraspanin n=1 Tax=Schistocephalus solidus TaxID=70667 RepID=A0A0X3PP00_SCHSO
METSSPQRRSDRLITPQDGQKSLKKKSCALTPSWVKTFLIFFTLIIMTIALSFICLGSYFTIVRNPRFPALLGEIAFINNYLMISLGILLTIVCIFGFFAISNGEVRLLKWYAILLTICLVIQFGAVGAALGYFQASYAWNADRLTSIMVNEYEETNEKIFNAVNGLHKEFQCCGSRSYRDWAHSLYAEKASGEKVNKNSTKPKHVPFSCCIAPYTNCGSIIHPSNIYYGGCMAAISDKLRETLFIILVVLLALAVVEFIGVILACCYWKAPKYAYE